MTTTTTTTATDIADAVAYAVDAAAMFHAATEVLEQALVARNLAEKAALADETPANLIRAELAAMTLEAARTMWDSYRVAMDAADYEVANLRGEIGRGY